MSKIPLEEALSTLGLPRFLRPRIERSGQPYVDEPRFNELRPHPLADAIHHAIHGRSLMPLRTFAGIERIRLNWGGEA